MVSLTNFRSLSNLGDDVDANQHQQSARNSPIASQGPPTPPLGIVEPKPKSKYSPLSSETNWQQQHQTMGDKDNASSQQQDQNKYTNTDKKQHHQQDDHFEIRWSNLSYCVQPKWYERQISKLSASSKDAKDRLSAEPVAEQTDNVQEMSRRQAKGAKTILNNLNGSVCSGQVTAILGPSGAGKTSLLGCLTGKHKTGVSGIVQVISKRQAPLSICTIPQKDYLLGQLSVRENLWFASRLKNPVDDFDHDSNIHRVLDLLKLQSCIDTKISKISGGQYKRVSIAQELLSSPDILILDEPTSGLDSLTCYKTVMVLRDLAQLSYNPMAIIVTIHQPQREVFDLFNSVYILATGGQCIFEGVPQNCIKTINRCSNNSLAAFDERQYNPASFLVEIASGEFGPKPIEALVANQAREFRDRCAALPNEEPPIAAESFDENGQFNLNVGSQPTPFSSKQMLDAASGVTPGLLRKRESAMARLKTTLTSFVPRTPTLKPRQAKGAGLRHNAHSTPAQLCAYANDAFTSHDSESVSNNDGKTTTLGGGTNGEHEASSVGQQSTTASSQFDCLDSLNEFYLDDRLQTHKHNHEGHFYRHCSLLTRRSWLCLSKDPMLTTLRFTAHIIVPLLITIVYGNRVGKYNACPLYETELDLIDYARRGTARLLGLQDELRSTFENVGLYFLSTYAFTFSTMCLTSLSFPLNMHVLLKEVRNGWYSIPTYFIGKTLADFPLEFLLPTVTLMITYPMTGQPSSAYEWRFITATLVFVVTSLIAQTQGLIFGALFMNAMQAAVFIAPVSTTPLILLSGFLIRIKKMPIYLQYLSSFSYFRYAIESLTILRYGFGQCECDPTLVTGAPVNPVGVPEQLRTMTNYWLSTFDSENSPVQDPDSPLNSTLSTLANSTANPQNVDFFQDLTVLLARANSFGANITTCDDLKPYPMIDFGLEDNQLYVWLSALMTTLVVFKIANYFVVKYSVKLRL